MKTRTCGRCNGKDTILICMECLRELKEERNAEVKQIMSDFENKLRDNHFIITEELLKELLQKLRLDAKDEGGEHGD